MPLLRYKVTIALNDAASPLTLYVVGGQVSPEISSVHPGKEQGHALAVVKAHLQADGWIVCPAGHARLFPAADDRGIALRVEARGSCVALQLGRLALKHL